MGPKWYILIGCIPSLNVRAGCYTAGKARLASAGSGNTPGLANRNYPLSGRPTGKNSVWRILTVLPPKMTGSLSKEGTRSRAHVHRKLFDTFHAGSYGWCLPFISLGPAAPAYLGRYPSRLPAFPQQQCGSAVALSCMACLECI